MIITDLDLILFFISQHNRHDIKDQFYKLEHHGNGNPQVETQSSSQSRHYSLGLQYKVEQCLI